MKKRLLTGLLLLAGLHASISLHAFDTYSYPGEHVSRDFYIKEVKDNKGNNELFERSFHLGWYGLGSKNSEGDMQLDAAIIEDIEWLANKLKAKKRKKAYSSKKSGPPVTRAFRNGKWVDLKSYDAGNCKWVDITPAPAPAPAPVQQKAQSAFIGLAAACVAGWMSWFG